MQVLHPAQNIKKFQKMIIFVDKKNFLRYYYCMKQLTNKDMQKLKGQLNDMNYQLSDDPNAVVTLINNSINVNTTNSVCKIVQVTSDIQ